MKKLMFICISISSFFIAIGQSKVNMEFLLQVYKADASLQIELLKKGGFTLCRDVYVPWPSKDQIDYRHPITPTDSDPKRHNGWEYISIDSEAGHVYYFTQQRDFFSMLNNEFKNDTSSCKKTYSFSYTEDPYKPSYQCDGVKLIFNLIPNRDLYQYVLIYKHQGE